MQQALCQALGKGISHSWCYLGHWENLTQAKLKKKKKENGNGNAIIPPLPCQGISSAQPVFLRTICSHSSQTLEEHPRLGCCQD